MASKKMVVVAALLLVALALEAAPPAAAMDCKAGCAEVTGPLGMSTEECMKNCAAIAKEQGPRDPNLDQKRDIP
jgi:hypothetical protein